MVVTQRRDIVGNIEDIKQSQKLNGSGNGQVQNQDTRLLSVPEKKLNGLKISSVAKKYFKFVSYPIECLVCAVAIFYLILFFSPLLFVYNMLKFVERKWVSLKSGAVAMSGRDALWLQDTKDNRMIINSAMVLKCTDIQHLVHGIQTIVLRCIAMKNEKGKLVFPRLTKCVHSGIFQYFLSEAENFDIAEHVFAYKGLVPKSHEEMEKLISTLSAQDISFDNPPWHFIIIPKTYDDNEAIMLFRVHHSLADGVSLTKFLLEQFPDEKISDKQLVKFSNIERKWMYLNALISGARILVKKLFSAPDRSILHGHSLKGVKKMTWSKPIDLQVVKNIKNYTETTVNDVMMACVSMSFHDYFKAHGVSTPPDLTASVPVDVRPKSQHVELENNFAIVSLKLPVSKRNPIESLYKTKAHMDDIKRSGEAFAFTILGNLSVDCIPDSITLLWNGPIADKHSLVLSNVPGPQAPFSVAGHQVTAIFFSPPQRNLVGIGVGLYSYAGQFTIGVQSDLNCMVDPKWIVNAFQSRLEQLEKCVANVNGHNGFDSGIE